MHLKFLARGTGSAAVAAAYLLAVKDASGKARVSVEVLRGDPHAVAAVADGLPFKHRYTSGVVAWSPEDAPTRPELERFVDEFEKTAWAGLDPDRYAWAVVLHRDDDGGVHLHIFVARCDLATGVSLNIAPPGWERMFDPLRDAFNHEHGWSRPDDPSRLRPFRPAPHLAYQARAARRSGEDVEPDVRKEIGMHLLELVAAGRVKDRAGVVVALEARGYEVPRQGEHYLTARDPATGKRWRLKGALYERDFDRGRFLREAPESSGDRDRADVDDDPAAAAWKAVEKARRRRADYNRAYYGPGRRPGRVRVQAAGAGGEVARERGLAAGRSAGRDASLASHLEQELGDGAVAAVTEAAESVREGGEERSLAAVTPALAEAAVAAGPDLSRAFREHVAIREGAVCATSTGGEWLAEAQREILGEEGRPLTVGERARAVEVIEGRLETDFSRRESEVAATSFGPSLLQAAFEEFSEGDAPLSFSVRERVVDQVGQRVDEELRTQEEALRSVPPGRRYLSEAEQARRAAEAAGPPTLAERESMVRTAEQQVGEELDRLEEELRAIAAGEDLLAESAGALAGDGRSLGERWEACERVRSGLEDELDRQEAAVLENPAGEELLHDARLEVLGAADREAATLGERTRIVKVAVDLAVAVHERAVCATSTGREWLAEAQQEVLEEEDRPLTVGERARAVETVEDRLETDLSRRESEVAATSFGSSLLQAAFGERSERDAPLSFSEREQALEQVEQRVDEELRTQEEALRSIPPGRRYLSEAEQARAAEAAGPPTLAERESMVRAVEQQVGEELDRFEEELRAIAVGEDLLAEAAGALAGDGGTRSLGARWEVCERVTSELEEKLDREEAAVLEDPSGEELLRAARLEVLGADDREAATLGERARIVKAAAAAKHDADERWNEEKAARVEAVGRLPGGLDLYHAHLADLDPKWSLTENTPPSREHDEAALAAAESDDTRLKRLRNVLSNKADAACYQEVLDQVAGQFKTSDLDSALAAGEKSRAERKRQEWEEKRDALVDELRAAPGGLDLYHAHLADGDPKWDRKRHDKSSRENINAALAAAQSDAPRLERLRNVLSNKADAACYQEVLDQVAGQFKTSDLDSALTAAEQAREDREWEEQKNARVYALDTRPGGLDLYHAHLADLDPQWGVNGNTTTARDNIDAALTAAESDAPRLERLRGVLSDEAGAARYQEELGKVAGQFKTSDLDRALAGTQKRKHEAALRIATRQTRDAAARSDFDLHDADVRAIYAAEKTHEAGIVAVTRATEALSTAADQQLPRETIIETWEENRSDPGGIAAALETVTAAAREEQERQERQEEEHAAQQQRWDNLGAFPGAQDAACALLDRLEPGWRDKGGVSPQLFDQVIATVEQRLPETLDARQKERRQGPNFDYEHCFRYDKLLEQARTRELGDLAARPAAPQQRAQVLDTADLLDGVERVVGHAQHTCKELLGEEALPSHDTVRTALRTVADKARHADPRWKQIAEAAASGSLDYLDPGPGGERAAIKQMYIAADRKQAREEANTQYQEALGDWNALGPVKKAFTRQPERQEPEEPAPPTRARIDEYRQKTLIRRIVQKIRAVLDYFLDRELVPADRAAARALEQPREREPRQPEHDPGHYRGR